MGSKLVVKISYHLESSIPVQEMPPFETATVEELEDDSSLTIDESSVQTPIILPSFSSENQISTSTMKNSTSRDPTTLHDTESADPQRIEDDLNGLKSTMPSALMNVLKKFNSRGKIMNAQLHELISRVGLPVLVSDYFLNGTPQPDQYNEYHTISENLLGLKNALLKQKRELDIHAQKAVKDSDLLWEKVTACDDKIQNLSKSPNAAPSANFERLQKKVAEDLAKNASISSGSAFSVMDISSRIVEVENNFKRLNAKLEATSKAVGLLKNLETSNTGSFGVNHNLNSIRDRLTKLEEERDAQHSNNLFESSTLDSRINLLQMDLAELKKDNRLELASSEVNEWLDAKLKAFLESPEMLAKLKSDSNYRLTNWTLLPRNLSMGTREMFVQVMGLEV